MTDDINIENELLYQKVNNASYIYIRSLIVSFLLVPFHFLKKIYNYVSIKLLVCFHYNYKPVLTNKNNPNKLKYFFYYLHNKLNKKPITFRWFFRLNGLEFFFNYFWILKDYYWLQNYYKLSFFFSILTLLWCFFMFFYVFKYFHLYEIINSICLLLWLLANINWMLVDYIENYYKEIFYNFNFLVFNNLNLFAQSISSNSSLNLLSNMFFTPNNKNSLELQEFITKHLVNDQNKLKLSSNLIGNFNSYYQSFLNFILKLIKDKNNYFTYVILNINKNYNNLTSKVLLIAFLIQACLFFVIIPFNVFKVNDTFLYKYNNSAIKLSPNSFIYNFFKNYRNYENFHIFLWISKDLLWFNLNFPGWYLLFLLNLLYLYHIIKLNISSNLSSNIMNCYFFFIILLWILSNSLWAFYDIILFYSKNNLKFSNFFFFSSYVYRKDYNDYVFSLNYFNNILKSNNEIDSRRYLSSTNSFFPSLFSTQHTMNNTTSLPFSNNIISTSYTFFNENHSYNFTLEFFNQFVLENNSIFDLVLDKNLLNNLASNSLLVSNFYSTNLLTFNSFKISSPFTYSYPSTSSSFSHSSFIKFLDVIKFSSYPKNILILAIFIILLLHFYWFYLSFLNKNKYNKKKYFTMISTKNSESNNKDILNSSSNIFLYSSDSEEDE